MFIVCWSTQLGDLAGNAMSLTVISAMQIGVLAAKQLRVECLESGVEPEIVLKNRAALPRKSLRDRLNKDIALNTMEESEKLKLPCVSNVFKKLLPLASEAVKTSILCTCESSGRNSDTLEFVQCRVCGVSCCRNCIHSTSGIQLKSHDTQSLSLNSREAQGAFQSKLQCIVPMSLVFGKEGISSLSSDHCAKDLDKFLFSLHRIWRDKKSWRIVYYARADCGVGEVIAEFIVTVGEIETRGTNETDVKVGVEGSLRCFLPAKLPPVVYGDLNICAKVALLSNNKFAWAERKQINKLTDLVVTGQGASPSFRAELGINDGAPKSIAATSNSSHKKKAVTAAKTRGEERRFFYPKNWKTWPETIVISSGNAAASTICGNYIRANCRQTTNQSALWIRAADGSKPALYLLMHPKISRNGPDYAVITSSMSHQDLSSILAVFPNSWQPCDALNSRLHQVKGVELTDWCPSLIECRVLPSDIEITSPIDHFSNTLLKISGLSELDVKMLSWNDAAETSSGLLSLNVCRGQAAQQTVRVFNSICVARMQQHAAMGLLKHDLSPDAKWIDYTPCSGDIIGGDESIVPHRPPEMWVFDAERKAWARQFGPEASRKYFTALQNAPRTFAVALCMNERTLVVKCDPKIAVHRAARNLIEGRGNPTVLSKELAVQYRFVDSARQKDPTLDPFHVSNCELLDPTWVGLKAPYELYDRQKKVVTKMTLIEDEGTSFEELEMFEDGMPGSTGWSLVAKASRNRYIHGGVIADAIGAGSESYCDDARC